MKKYIIFPSVGLGQVLIDRVNSDFLTENTDINTKICTSLLYHNNGSVAVIVADRFKKYFTESELNLCVDLPNGWNITSGIF